MDRIARRPRPRGRGKRGVNAPRIHALAGNQALAVVPQDSVWLSASAGTGKTQVLTARVLRLLLTPGVEPGQILCLTFTRAGATEMAARINDKLAQWVRADPVTLAAELGAIGADIGPEAQARARTLFAAVLDCPGGGLRIDTIHAFSQWLLAAFPEEAGLAAGARPMEEHEKALLSRSVLADLLVDAEARGQDAVLNALASLVLRLGEDGALGFLARCAGARGLWFGPGSWQVGGLLERVNRLLGLPGDAGDDWLAAMLADDAFDVVSLRRVLAAYQQWKTVTGEKAANLIGDWLAAEPAGRLAGLDGLYGLLLTKEGEVKNRKALDKIDPAAVEAAARVAARAEAVQQQRVLVGLARWLAPALELGRAYALAWEEAKAREGLIDFDDQIARAADLLARADMAGWIRYKLDRRFDHILVDEAQDTNAAQWGIIGALTDDFFSGAGAKEGRARTLFVVGDYKQAIFGFQGTSPENFEKARARFDRLLADAAENAAMLRGGPALKGLQKLGLVRSFRTSAPILDFVNRAIREIGPAAFGLAEAPEDHVGETRPGQVVLWRPISGRVREDDDGADDGAITAPERELADRIARQILHWKHTNFPLLKGGTPRRASEGDIMILVRKRRELAGLIVARLHAAGVKVAGVDRLRLAAPLAVRDLMAALRFAAQPFDDLNLAALLVSPLIGWTQAQLLAHGWREKGVRLWAHLRRSTHVEVVALREKLGALLARADYLAVPALLDWLLVGPWAGRRALVERLGREANDPIDELVNAAHAFAATATPSLVGFLNWFDAAESGGTGGELKREGDSGGDFVRVMTVHGSKGLQAPIVILADATGDPESRGRETIDLPVPGLPDARVPLPRLRSAEVLGPLAAARDAARKAEAEEHWRLLYVAMTRAEEMLCVCGALGPDGKLPEQSWYARLQDLWGDEWVEDAIWGARLTHGVAPGDVAWTAETLKLDIEAALPGWVRRAAPDEPRPARPLVPSALGDDVAAQPPAAASVGGADAAVLAAAARRGTLIHALLQRLPDVAPDGRALAAVRWLARAAADLPAAARDEMADAALRVVADPRWAELFAGANVLAEAPIAALVGGDVITGTIDRLLVMPDRIRLIDFKTTRRVPPSADHVSVPILRQMAAYAAALAVTWPGRAIEAAVLFTSGPTLIELPPELLATHAPGAKTAFAQPHESL